MTEFEAAVRRADWRAWRRTARLPVVGLLGVATVALLVLLDLAASVAAAVTGAGLLAAVLASTTPPVRHLVARRRLTAGRLSGPAVGLTDRALLTQWNRTRRALELSRCRPEHAGRILARRVELLDELTRRGLLERL